MLEGLDEINWSQLHHAYGEASDVPVLIRKLLSKDENERNEALDHLFGNIWHQGTIWEASSYAVPFLWELLKSPETPDKLQVASLLTALATGKHSYYGVMEDEKRQQSRRGILAKRGKILEEEIEKANKYGEVLRITITKEFHLFYPYLLCDEPDIRSLVAQTFGEYPEFKTETLPLLKKALASESNVYAKKTMENSIKILIESK